MLFSVLVTYLRCHKKLLDWLLVVIRLSLKLLRLVGMFFH